MKNELYKRDGFYSFFFMYSEKIFDRSGIFET